MSFWNVQVSVHQHLGRQDDARLDVTAQGLFFHELLRRDIAKLTVILCSNSRPSMHYGRRLDLSAGQNGWYTDSATPSGEVAYTGIGWVTEVDAGEAKELRAGIWSVMETDDVEEHRGSMV